MERLFSKHIDVLRAAAADDIERKVRVCCLLRLRSIFLWAALPLVLALAGVTVILISFYVSVLRNETDAKLFLKVSDIFSIFTGALLAMTLACLGIVAAADKMLGLLSSLRPDENDSEDPVVAFPAPAEKERQPATIETVYENVPQEDGTPTFSEIEADRQWESSRFVCESVG